MRRHVRPVLRHTGIVHEAVRTGTSAADNVQRVNLIFLFMINSAFIEG